jgi:hypothetical protein
VSEHKGLGQRTKTELEAVFGDMYAGWDRGMVVVKERFGNGETRFTETPMTVLELEARYVAAEIGINIYEIANRAAFAPIIVFSQIQAYLRPVFDEQQAEIDRLAARLKELETILNTPEYERFGSALQAEAAHQVYRWGVEHDAAKSAWDWFWTLGYLGSKAAHASLARDWEKAKHHTITAAALLANWHKHISAAARQPSQSDEG